MNEILRLICGLDIPIPQCQLTIHQPTIKEIALLGEQTYFEGIQTMCVDKRLLDNKMLETITNFQIFMMIMNEKETISKRQAVEQTCMLILPNCKLTFLPNSFIISGNGNTSTIDENNFEFLQEVLKLIICAGRGTDQIIYNPGNKKAEEIAKKIMKGREKVAKQKGNTSSIFAQYISILTVGLNSMSINDLINCTMFQLFDLVERYQLHLSWDIDIKSRLAGAKPDKEVDNWMKNIH